MPRKSSTSDMLKTLGLRDTQSRRMVIDALHKIKKPASPYDIHAWIEKQGNTISTVTIYRIIDVLRTLGMVHRHPCSGLFAACSLPGTEGTHAYLHCHDCGSSEEIASVELLKVADKEAATHKFSIAHPMLEISGTCKHCSRS